jgi:glutaredoxin-related protein
MSRPVLDEVQIHPAIREKIANWKQAVVQEVQAAVISSPVVVVGMSMNPFPRKARRLLDAANVPHQYLEYGSYFSRWRDRSALKFWTGWPTLPIVFVKGTLIGGADDLDALIKSGELKKMLG